MIGNFPRLGIKPEFRHLTCHVPQYPLSYQKRLHMINYTIENDLNGFWHPINHSLHCIPHTLVPKKLRGVVYRMRPAFDARVVNQYCELFPFQKSSRIKQIGNKFLVIFYFLSI